MKAVATEHVPDAFSSLSRVDSHETMSLVANYSGSESDQSGSDDDEDNTSSRLAPKTSSEDTQNINFLTAEFSESESEGDLRYLPSLWFVLIKYRWRLVEFGRISVFKRS